MSQGLAPACQPAVLLGNTTAATTVTGVLASIRFDCVTPTVSLVCVCRCRHVPLAWSDRPRWLHCAVVHCVPVAWRQHHDSDPVSHCTCVDCPIGPSPRHHAILILPPIGSSHTPSDCDRSVVDTDHHTLIRPARRQLFPPRQRHPRRRHSRTHDTYVTRGVFPLRLVLIVCCAGVVLQHRARYRLTVLVSLRTLALWLPWMWSARG